MDWNSILERILQRSTEFRKGKSGYRGLCSARWKIFWRDSDWKHDWCMSSPYERNNRPSAGIVVKFIKRGSAEKILSAVKGCSNFKKYTKVQIKYEGTKIPYRLISIRIKCFYGSRSVLLGKACVSKRE